MTQSREAVAAALLALFQAAPGGFVTISRRHLAPPVVTPEQQPALFLVQHEETTTQRFIGVPGVTVMETVAIIYCAGPGSDEPLGAETVLIETTLHSLIDDVEAALQAPAGERQTLGGLVQHCWIEGKTFKDPGVIGNQAVAVVPIRILVP